MIQEDEIFEMKIVSGGRIVVYVKIPYANLDDKNWRDNLEKLIELNRPARLKPKMSNSQLNKTGGKKQNKV